MASLRRNRDTLKPDASPSLSLENGGYRIRAPRLAVRIEPLEYSNGILSAQPSTPPPTPRVAPPERLNQNLILVLAILTLCCVASFASAYYLYTTMWDINPWKASTPQANGPGPMKAFVLEDRDSGVPLPLAGTKYLSYLPHSGVHNQRIALENALTLAHLLNRTLLVPPIRVARRPVRYLPFDTLDYNLQLIGPEGLEHCGNIPSYISLPVECLDYFESTTLQWEDLFDISSIEQGQPIRLLYTHSSSPYSDRLSLLPGGVAQLKDDSRYHYHFVDAGARPPQDKYEETVSIPELAQAPEVLLQLGTLFGTNRLILSNEGLSLLSSIRQAMILRNKTIERIAKAVMKRIPACYIGLHMRVGDGQFSERKEAIIRDSWSRLFQRLECTTNDMDAIALFYGSTLGSNLSSSNPSTVFRVGSEEQELGRTSHFSRLRVHCHELSTPIFVSTDLKHPRRNPLLAPFLLTFPSLYFISDFPDEVEPLRSMRNPDGVELYDYLLPFLEAMLVARGKVVVGTRGSTFSQFITQNLWPAYHLAQEGKHVDSVKEA